jgi:hypothetical protein
MPESDERPDQDVPEWLTELFYTGVGLAVIAVNRAQVARRSVEDQVRASEFGPGLEAIDDLLSDPDRVTRIVSILRDEVGRIDERVDGIEDRLVELCERLEPDLPPVAAETVRALRHLAGEHAPTLRVLFGLGRSGE